LYGRALSSIKEILKEGTEKLRGVTQNPQKEVLTLLAYSLHVEPLWLMGHDDEPIDIPKDFLENFKKREESYPFFDIF